MATGPDTFAQKNISSDFGQQHDSKAQFIVAFLREILEGHTFSIKAQHFFLSRIHIGIDNTPTSIQKATINQTQFEAEFLREML